MRVILFRHGPASPHDARVWPDDDLRPLSSPGARLTRAAAEGLARIEPGIEQVVSSPLSRARQSARVLADVLDTGEIEELDALRPEGSLEDVLEFLTARVSGRTLVMVGHEPGLGQLAGALLCGSPAALPLKKAGGCAIRFEGPPRECSGRLSWFLSAKILRRAAAMRPRS